MAEPTKETQEKIQQLQMLEQNLNNFTMQKQNFQLQLHEIESALKEIEGQKKVYRIIGGIMVSSPTEKVKKELAENKDATEARIKSIDTQEEKLRGKANSIKEEVMGSVEGN